MSLTDAPGIITRLAAHLVACPSWTPGASGIWYPEAAGDITTTHAVLTPTTTNRNRYAEGARGLRGGTLWILLYIVGTDSLGDAETLGDDLVDELMLQQDGIAFRDITCDLAQDPGAAKAVGGSTITPFLITIDHGLSA